MSSSLCEGFTFDERLGIYFTVQSSAYVYLPFSLALELIDLYHTRSLSVAAVLVLLSYAAVSSPFLTGPHIGLPN